MSFVSRLIRVPFAASLLAHGTDSPEVMVRFREAGWITGLAVGSLDDSVAARASLALKIEDDGQRALTLNGERRADFCLFENISPATGAGGHNFPSLPLVVPVESGETWHFTARNRNAVTDYAPQAVLSFVSKKDWLEALGPDARFRAPETLPVPPPTFSKLPPITRIITLDVASLATLISSPYQLVEYPEPCIVVGVRASHVENATARRQDIGLELYDPDCEQSITTTTDSINADFAPLALAAISPELTIPLRSARNTSGHHRVRVMNLGTGTLISQVAFLVRGSPRGRS